MASQIHKKGPVTPAMNITPLIDVVFLLIIFFMLVNNIIAEESVEMIVPNLEDPKTQETPDINRLMINVAPQPFSKDRYKNDPLIYSGHAVAVKVGLQYFSIDDMEGLAISLANTVEHGPKDENQNSKLHVLLRADAALHYDAVQPIMEAITAAGINKINLVAYLPDQGPVSR